MALAVMSRGILGTEPSGVDLFGLNDSGIDETCKHIAVTFKNVWTGVMQRMMVPKPLWGLTFKDNKQFMQDIATIQHVTCM